MPSVPQIEKDETGQAWSDDALAANPHEADDKAQRVERMFAAIARRYDLNNRLHSFWRDQAWRRRAVALAKIGGDDDVLDVACGTGDLSEAFCDAGPRSVKGVDFTEAMLDVARHKASHRRRRGGGPTPTYEHGDAMNLDLPDESFDVVSIAFGIRNVSDPAGAIAEFRRVLRPGGRLVVLEFSEPANPLLRRMNSLYTQHIMPCTATIIAGDRSGAYKYLPRSVATFATSADLAAIVEAAGFDDVRQVPMTFGVCVATVGVRGARN